MIKRRAFPVIFTCLLFWPLAALAHQPELVVQTPVNISDPEISKAYYGELKGQPDVFVLTAKSPFSLYVNVLEPDVPGQPKNTSALLIKRYSPDSRPYATLDGVNFRWTSFWEPFGADSYWRGPEFRTQAEAGSYEIQVSSPTNQGKYVLAVGETEAFGLKETIRALRIIPLLKRDFFSESPVSFIRSPFGWGMILAIYLLVVIVGLLAHFAVRKIGKKRRSLKLSAEHRLLVGGLGICLLLWAVATTWNPIVIFLSGVCLFEASQAYHMKLLS